MRLNINRKNILLASILFVLIAAVLVLSQAGLFKNKNEQTNLPPPPKYTKTDLPANKLPDVFPKDIIQEKNVVILENYEADMGNGKKQYTIKYLSEKKLPDIYKEYMDYLNKNKWGIIVTSLKSSYLTLEYAKVPDWLNISATKNNSLGKVLVDITLTRSYAFKQIK